MYFLLEIAAFVTGLDVLPEIPQLSLDFLHPDYSLALTYPNAALVKWLAFLGGFEGAGKVITFLLLFFSIVIAIPVLGALFLISSVMTNITYLLYAAGVDLIWYLLDWLLFGTPPTIQISRRFFALFPDIGDAHYDKSYRKFLRQNHKRFEENKKRRIDEFYDD